MEAARERRGAWQGATIEPRVGNEAAWQELEAFEPAYRRLTSRRLTARGGTRASAEIDMLRTRLLKQMRGNGWTRVMVTSPTAGCGKSTVTANLALAIQRQADVRCLVMDLDLKRAALGDVLGLRPSHGVLELLKGQVSASDQLRRVGSNLALSVSAKGASLPGDVLKSTEARRQIESVQSLLSPGVVLFDCPPFFAGDDAFAVSRFADCALIVGAAGESSVAQIEATERDLAQHVEIAGIVLNKCRFQPPEGVGNAAYY